jgi:hypothetical protein
MFKAETTVVTSLLKNQPASFEQYGIWTSAKNQGHSLVPVVVRSKENNNCTGVNRPAKALFCASGSSGTCLIASPWRLSDPNVNFSMNLARKETDVV